MQVIFPHAVFHFSSYWCNWNRLLMFQQQNGCSFQYLEISLTAINPSLPEAWEDVRPIKLRLHSTIPSLGDKFQTLLPLIAVQSMIDHLNPETIETLLFEDIFQCIDWENFLKLNNPGGTPLDQVRPR